MKFSKDVLSQLNSSKPHDKEKEGNILLVDDEPHNVEALASLLEEYYCIFRASNGQEALEILKKQTPMHLILTDQKMPVMTGVEFLEKSLEFAPDSIRMILTGYSDIDVVMDAINKAKVYKFILKPYDMNEVFLTVQRALEAWRLADNNRQLVLRLQKINNELEDKVKDRTEALEETINQLTLFSITDQLTGAYNRRKYNEAIAQEIETWKRYRQPLSMILFDIDFFKDINDSFGHIQGDCVLKDMATLIQKNIRSMDLFFRVGGEEFLVLTPNIGLEQAHSLAEKLRKKVERHVFACNRGLSISLGVAEYRLGETSEHFFHRADQAMYSAKQLGRNCVVCDDHN